MLKRRWELRLLTGLFLACASVVFTLEMIKLTTIRKSYKTSLDRIGNLRFIRKEVHKMSLENVTTTNALASNSDLLDPFEALFARRRELADLICTKRNPDFRQAQINSTRNGKKLKNGIVMERTIVDLKKRALMCFTLKAGSSSWNDVFWQLREPEIAAKLAFFERAVHGNQKYYKELSDKQRSELYMDPDTVTMMSIRHPFARLISGWEDKFTKRYYYNRWFEEYPLMKNYPNEYGSWNGLSHFMSWESFMQYVADHGSTLSNLDAHFQPTSCDPCIFPFKLIVKAETFEMSKHWILNEKLHVDSIRELNKGRQSRKPEETIREMFSRLKHETVKQVMNIFAEEMEMFGYTFDLNSLTAGGWND